MLEVTAVESCAEGLLIDADEETVEAARICVDRLREAVALGQTDLIKGKPPSHTQRRTLEALLIFFDRWSGAQVQAWSGLAAVDEEAAPLRRQLAEMQSLSSSSSSSQKKKKNLKKTNKQ